MDSNKPIIAPIAKEKLEAELTKERFVRNTNKGGNQIYDFRGDDAPNLMLEVGRLREESFRQAGGGTGKEADIDDYDTAEVPYRQLIVWDPEEREILGGYRYIMGNSVPRDKDGNVTLATSRLFHFSQKFLNEYFPETIELGRSFVQPQYQSSKQGSKSLFALDNLWDGLGSLIVNNPEMKYFFGKVTMYNHYNQEARDLILSFMNRYFCDPDNLVYPHEEFKVKIGLTPEEINRIFPGPTFVEDYKILNRKVRKLGETIPPLVNAYMNLSPSMRSFGTAVNDRFGDVEETGIIITIKEFNQAKTERHVESYNPNDSYR